MASEPKRQSKTEVLSMRMDPKTRFLVDFIAKARGQSITTVVERAILEAADNVKVGQSDKSWRSFWHLSEGVRSLLLANEQSLYPNYEDEYRLDFARQHWPFFYFDKDLKLLKPHMINVLWPRIDEFIEVWEATRAANYFLAGEVMGEALKKAGLNAPEWPPKVPKPKVAAPPPPPPPPPPPSSGGSPSWEPAGGDLDDEIPF